ncbi:MAG: hypothetical protein ACOC3J_02355 [Gemmatimonadota bacterium]
MKRIILGFLLLGLAVLLVPGLRERAQPHIDPGRQWLGQKLEGPLAPVLTPYRTLKTETRMAEAASLLIRNRNRGQDAPAPAAFRDYLMRHEVDPFDGWGAPLLIEQEPDSLAIISAGPDLEYRTEDDIVTRIRYRAPTQRVRRFR